MATKVIIAGAAGRDFHNFNVHFRDNPAYEVVAFTATQIPDIEGRTYPPSLAGKLYPRGIPIVAEADMAELIQRHDADEVVFAYSDVPYARVMSMSALANAEGADFVLMGGKATMLKSPKPLISVCAVRTGCGKSQTTRYIYDILRRMNKRAVAIRHPMPYGDLEAQKVQRFATIEDLARHHCTIEEMEEHEPHIAAGNVSYGGVDYEAILCAAIETDRPDVVLFDGGNNDMPFYKPDLHVVVVDPLRAGHEVAYYPGEANLRMADVVVINKMDSASPEQLGIVRANIARLAPKAVVVEADSELTLDRDIRGRRVLVIEDGPTLTHGEMQFGAAMVAARRFGAAEIVDPRPHAVGRIAETYEKYPKIGQGILPAMGYSDQQTRDLQATINAIDADLVLSGTPIDLTRIVSVNKPVIRVRYDLKPRPGSVGLLEKAVERVLQSVPSPSGRGLG
ncbi:MAG: GTPase [Thermoguttaceae bacterium]